jgi:predicted nuclease of predicted toxin-antitoxin system
VATLYSDENVSARLVEQLEELGHDVLTALNDGKANRGLPDDEVLARAVQLERCVLTNNRQHFHRIHRTIRGKHFGIVTYTNDQDVAGLASRIHAAISNVEQLAGKLIRIHRER